MVSAEDFPSIDEWLTETEIGGADDTYSGNLVDHRDQNRMTIDVGASGNDGISAFPRQQSCFDPNGHRVVVDGRG
jgi:hypothetical protein